MSHIFAITAGSDVSERAPGMTRPMKPGDVVEVEVEKVGVLRNRVVAAKRR